MIIEFYVETFTEKSVNAVITELANLNESDVDQRFHSTHRLRKGDDYYFFSIRGTWDLYRVIGDEFKNLGISSLEHFEED